MGHGQLNSILGSYSILGIDPPPQLVQIYRLYIVDKSMLPEGAKSSLLFLCGVSNYLKPSRECDTVPVTDAQLPGVGIKRKQYPKKET